MSTWEDIEKWLDQSKEKEFVSGSYGDPYRSTQRAINSKKEARAAVISLQSRADESDDLREMLKDANRRITELEIQVERDARTWDERLDEAMREFRNNWEANVQAAEAEQP